MTYHIQIEHPQTADGFIKFTIDAGLLKKEDRLIPEKNLRELFADNTRASIDFLNEGQALILSPLTTWYLVANKIEKALYDPNNRSTLDVRWTDDFNEPFSLDDFEEDYEEEDTYKEIHFLVGSAKIEKSIRVGDPTYSWDTPHVWDIESASGKWNFEISCKYNGLGYGITSMFAFHTELHPDDLNELDEDSFFEAITVDSGSAAMFFDAPEKNDSDSKSKVVEQLIEKIEKNEGLALVFDESLKAFAACTFAGDGYYEVRVLRDENQQALAIKLMLTTFE